MIRSRKIRRRNSLRGKEGNNGFYNKHTELGTVAEYPGGEVQGKVEIQYANSRERSSRTRVILVDVGDSEAIMADLITRRVY